MDNTCQLKDNNLLKKIGKEYSSLSEGKKRIAEYILNNWQEVAFLTAAKVGKKVNISEPVVTRFAVDLGYSGYPALQTELQRMIKARINTLEMLEESNISENNLAEKIWENELNNFNKTRSGLSHEDLEKTADLICRASKVFVFGSRGSTPLAVDFGMNLQKVLPNTIFFYPGTGDLYDKLRSIDKSTVLIGIGFPRYAKETVRVMKYAEKNDCQVIAITDNPLSPLAGIADISLYAASNYFSFFRSHTGAMVLCNVLLTMIAVRAKEQVKSALEELEEIYDEFEVFFKKNEL